jgi:hypothetical protein
VFEISARKLIMETSSGISSQGFFSRTFSHVGSVIMGGVGLVKAAANIVKTKWNNSKTRKEKGIEHIGRKAYDGSAKTPPQEQSDKKNETKTFNLPEGTTIEPEVLSAQNHGQSTTRLDSLRNRNSDPKSLKKSAAVNSLNLPASASPRVRLMAIMMVQAGRFKSAMDRDLERILEISEENHRLSKEIENESKKVAEIKKEAALTEGDASKLTARGEFYSSAGQAITTIPVIGAAGAIPAFFGGLAKIDAAMTRTDAADVTCDADLVQAEIQLKKDEQGINTNEMGVLQSSFSTASQEHSTTIGILQSMLASENDARRAIATNMR